MIDMCTCSNKCSSKQGFESLRLYSKYFFYLHDTNKYEIKLITYQIKSNLDTNIFDKSIEYDKNIENINK